MFKFSNDPMFQCSNVQKFKCSNGQMFERSNAQMFKGSNVQKFQCSNVTMFQCSNVQMFKSLIGLSGLPEAWAIQLLTKEWANWPTRKRYITPLSIAHTLNLIDQNLQQKSAVQSLTEFSPVLHWKQQTLPRKYIIPKWYHIDDTSLVPYMIFVIFLQSPDILFG